MVRLQKVLGAFLAFVMLSLSITPVFAEGIGLQIDAKSAVIMELSTGKVIFEQNSAEKLPPASVTKVMTILLIYDAVAQSKIKWDDMVTVSTHAASMGGSQIFLAENEQQKVKDLTKAIVIASANDAAVAMAEFIGGSEENFVTMMNEKALSLGMLNTHFVNACGLDTDGHVTSAYDIALMSRELMTKYPDVKEYTTTWMDTIIHQTSKGESEFGLTNTNKLIKWYDGATGLKTGSTGEALYCLSATAEKEGMELVAVIMAAPTADKRFAETARMLDYGFTNYGLVKGEAVGTSVGTVKIFKGEEEETEVVIKTEINALVEKGETVQLDSEIKILDALSAPVEKGTKAGEIIYSYKGQEVGRSDLVLYDNVDRASLSTILQKNLIKWFE